ncbi:hypothetical protein ADZ36_12505 [Streptomyces fradiae]|uniref:Uncharacterized protein n=1 Tax=Streptomyces fradiae TaxID=1906 RepID=A0ACC4WBY7_STRFR|nr:hypothetical protein ADZ36_12505 [Streptomyces fradiae]OFA56561.1 hypothetical protein BEN35_06270 [Streptomyces fradiae]
MALRRPGQPRVTDPQLPATTPAQRRRARERTRTLRAELPRVRAAAASWRNGLGALLAGLLGFGLIQGRSDVGELARPWGLTAGGLLAGALLAGLAGALCLMRAAHGTYRTTSPTAHTSQAAADHQETLVAAGRLLWGIRCALLCVLLLAAAVGTTWYGPGKDSALLRVDTPSESVCGSVLRLDDGKARLLTKDGQVTLALPKGSVVRPVDKCPAKAGAMTPPPE